MVKSWGRDLSEAVPSGVPSGAQLVFPFAAQRPKVCAAKSMRDAGSDEAEFEEEEEEEEEA